MKTNYENFIEVIDHILPEGPKVIVEAGGNKCEHTVMFAKKYPSAHIHTYECNPHNTQHCKEAISGVSNISLHEHALSNEAGKIKFYPMPENQAASSAFQHTTAKQECIEVEAYTLDIAADVLWLDAEGSELNILKGASDLSKTKLIHTEVHFKAAFEGQPLYKDVKKFLNENGFVLLKFSSYGRNFTDAIFVKKDLCKSYYPQFLTESLYTLKERLTGHTRAIIYRLGLKK